jgi:hypothetical protein
MMKSNRLLDFVRIIAEEQLGEPGTIRKIRKDTRHANAGEEKPLYLFA